MTIAKRPVPPDVRIEKAALPAGQSFNEFLATIREAAESSIKATYPSDDDYPGYVQDIYEDFLIYYVYSRGELQPSMHVRASWAVMDGKITIGEWTEVVEVTSYVEVRKNRWQKRSIFDSLFR